MAQIISTTLIEGVVQRSHFGTWFLESFNNLAFIASSCVSVVPLDCSSSFEPFFASSSSRFQEQLRRLRQIYVWLLWPSRKTVDWEGGAFVQQRLLLLRLAVLLLDFYVRAQTPRFGATFRIIRLGANQDSLSSRLCERYRLNISKSFIALRLPPLLMRWRTFNAPGGVNAKLFWEKL